MPRPARAFLAFHAVVVLVAIAVQIPITAGDADGLFPTPQGRVANLFTFFTIQTNVIVAVTCLALAIAPERRSTAVRALRLDALLGIIVTGLVFHVVLSGLYTFDGAEWYTNQVFHTVSPLLTVIGWVVFGPRGLIDLRTVVWSLVFPLAWLALTLVRGALTGWYPYPFIDVDDLGYAAVAVNSLGITAMFGVLAAGAMGLDRLLARSSRAVPAAQ